MRLSAWFRVSASSSLPAILLGVLFRFLAHPLDLLLGEAGGVLNCDGRGLSGGPVFSGHVEDSVGVDLEGHVDLGNPPGSGRDAGEDEPAQGFIVRGHLPLALNDVDLHRGLEILRRGEGFCALYRNGGVPLDDGGGDSTEGFDGEGERRDVQKDDLLHFAGEDGGLDGRAYRHHLIGVDVFVDLGPGRISRPQAPGPAGSAWIRPPTPPDRCPGA
jgi:hypothetical protein